MSRPERGPPENGSAALGANQSGAGMQEKPGKAQAESYREKAAAASCETCAFFSPFISNADFYPPANLRMGECRASPPKVAGDDNGSLNRGRGIWPAVEVNDWCGHHMGAAHAG